MCCLQEAANVGHHSDFVFMYKHTEREKGISLMKGNAYNRVKQEFW